MRPVAVPRYAPARPISIHALHTKCDFRIPDVRASKNNFNPRTSYEVRLISYNQKYKEEVFQSTHFIRSATILRKRGGKNERISIHALHTKCDLRVAENTWPAEIISIHALHTKCDKRSELRSKKTRRDFNPRTSYEVRLSKGF